MKKLLAQTLKVTLVHYAAVILYLFWILLLSFLKKKSEIVFIMLHSKAPIGPIIWEEIQFWPDPSDVFILNKNTWYKQYKPSVSGVSVIVQPIDHLIHILMHMQQVGPWVGLRKLNSTCWCIQADSFGLVVMNCNEFIYVVQMTINIFLWIECRVFHD